MARAIASALTSAPQPRARNLAAVAAPAAPTDLHVDQPVDPIVKWAGGKSRLLGELTSRLPNARQWTGKYFEPFAGGLALYFHLRPRTAVLADMNPELINLYKVVRDTPDALIDDLQRHTAERTYFYAVRALDPADLTPVERASRFVFLNRTCFNGLWRVNRSGQFNVPFGRYDNPTLCPEVRLRAASQALQGAALDHTDFESALVTARRGDFVYFDPPYDPITKTARFTSYTMGNFGDDDQRRLADLFARLAARGVRCMLSNSDTPFIRELYASFTIDTIMAPRAISRDATKRTPVREVIVRSYT